MDMPKALHIYRELRGVEKKSTGIVIDNIVISEMAKDAADAIQYLSDELFEMEKRRIKVD